MAAKRVEGSPSSSLEPAGAESTSTSSTERSDKALLSSRGQQNQHHQRRHQGSSSSSDDASSSSSSCFGRAFQSLSRRCEMTALAFLFGLPTGASEPILNCFYGKRTSEEGVELETKTQIVLQLGRLLSKEKNFNLVDLMRKDLARGRKWFERLLRRPKHRDVRSEDVSFPAAPGVAAPNQRWIGARIYTPKELADAGVPLPVLVYYHGGGWVIGNLNTVEGFLTHLCHWAKCVVVSVDYRLAPENPHPAATEDALSSFRWVAESCAARGWDPARIAVGGDSAGGSISAALCQRLLAEKAPVQPCLQVLLFPSVYLGPRNPAYKSIEEFGRDDFYTLPFKAMLYFRECYVGQSADGTDVGLSPVLAPDASLKGLPPAYFGLCHFDVLRDEGRDYARRLRENGVSVCVEEWRAHHGVTYLYGRMAYARECLKGVATHLRSQLYPSKL